MKTGTTELLKFQRLKRRLNEQLRGTVGLLELLWQRVAKNCPRGDIGKFTNEEIATLCDWPGDPNDLVDALVDTRWLDESPTHRLVVHDWDAHAPAWVKGVVLRNGGSFATLSDAPKLTDPGCVTQGTPPPNPTQPNLTKPSPTPASGDWGGLVGEVLLFGVKKAREAVDAARQRGATPNAIRELVKIAQHFREQGSLKDPAGALCWRIENWNPGQAAHEGWPGTFESPSPAAKESTFRPPPKLPRLSQQEQNEARDFFRSAFNGKSV